MAWQNLLERILFASQEVGSRHLPGSVRKAERGSPARIALDLLVRDDVFPQDSKRTPVVVGLRHQPPVFAIGCHVRCGGWCRRPTTTGVRLESWGNTSSRTSR